MGYSGKKFDEWSHDFGKKKIMVNSEPLWDLIARIVWWN